MQTAVQKEKKTDGQERPPIVVVMGHIDHGKTTLLDFIRKAKVAEKETGGITQHIGAYEAEHKGKKITFIDTPGHEAFGKMRSRGANVADIAILVVSAEEGVKQQTKEAIAIIQGAGVPFVVAVNKIDRPNADSARTRKDLAESGILVEEYGGKIPAVDISAKTGKNVDSLLDTVLLMAELEELRWDPALSASGVVIESHTDPRSGKAATLLLKEGFLKRGMFVLMGEAVASVRVLENFRGEPIDSAVAAMPVVVSGLAKEAELGDEFKAFSNKSDAEEYANLRGADRVGGLKETRAEEGKMMLSIILKTDVSGSREAVEHVVERLQFEKIGARILKSETGDVSESDFKLAGSGPNVVIVGFRVKVPPSLREIASLHGVTLIIRDVVYELEDEIKEEMAKRIPAEMQRADTGRARILKLFKKEKNRQIIGGLLSEGFVRRGAQFEVLRNKMKIGSGKILGLEREKQSADEVKEGFEFGLAVEASIDIAPADILSFFEEEKKIPALQ